MCVYGIYIDEELVYVGKTSRDIKVRHKEHKRNVEKMRKGEYKGTQINLYGGIIEALDNGKKVDTRIIIDVADVKTRAYLRNWEIQCMELALITLWKPKYNIQGVVKDYEFEYN